MSFPPGSPIHSAASSSSHINQSYADDEKQQRQPQTPRRTSKQPYRTEFRERQGSGSDESVGPYDHPPAPPPQKGFFKRMFSCFEFDDSDPVARYRPKHEAIFGKNPVYKNHQIQPQNEDQAKSIPSDTQAPNSFASGMTGGSGTGGGGCS